MRQDCVLHVRQHACMHGAAPARQRSLTGYGRSALHGSSPLAWHAAADFTINVLMLAWGARHVGPADEVRALRMDTDPQQEWMDMAIAHARQVTEHGRCAVLDCTGGRPRLMRASLCAATRALLSATVCAAQVAANHVRPDGTTYHIVE